MAAEQTRVASLSCSLASRQAGEQLFATAPQTRYWLLLEYPHPMGEKAFEESRIPAPVKTHLSNVLNNLPLSRLLLIRQPEVRNRGHLSLFICISHENNPRLYEIHLNTYADILTLDLLSILRGEEHPSQWERVAFLFLVCTNGKRDPCCARRGLPVYKQMSQFAAHSVWQTSHVGGHRFAPNIILLPYGIYYGRVESDQCQRLIEAARDNHLLIDFLRGRACYPPEVQAAEFFLRRETQNTQLDAFALFSDQKVDHNRWIVRFRSKTSELFELHLSGTSSDVEIFESCKTPEQRTRRTQYHLDKWLIRAHPGE